MKSANESSTNANYDDFAARRSGVSGDDEIQLPEFTSLLPVKLHPDSEELVPASDHWTRTYLRSCARTDAELETLIEAGLARLTCYMLPNAPRGAVQATCDLWQQVVLLDDAMSDRGWLGASIHAAQNAVGRIMTALTGWGSPDAATDAVRDAASRLRPYLPAERWERFAAEYADLLDGFLIEVATRNRDGLEDFEAYMKRRRITVGAKWVIVLAELMSGAELDPCVPSHPQVLQLRDVALDHLWLANDLFSFLKEQVRGEYISAIPLLQRCEGQRPQQAVTWLLDQVADQERKFFDLRRTILSGELAEHAGLSAYLDNVAHIMSGTLHWSWTTSRYHVPGRPDPRGAGWRPKPAPADAVDPPRRKT
ncbi:terpene synthase family protein [Kitasatospora purpeofusca]|uniref:terpene synthase family protein n=1 Tax=Kitasatospora purpeofusca TaxID=67352 RepID=UPI00368768A2